MPAAVRGESRASAKPRAKAPASSRSRPQAKKQGGYAPAKLRAAQGVGLSPAHALMAAAGVLTLALVITLATGHRAETLSDTTNSAVGSQLAGLGFKLKAVHVQGASAMATPDILKAAGVYLDQPVMGLDLSLIHI